MSNLPDTKKMMPSFFLFLINPCSTIVYELMSLDYPYKHLPTECVIWRVGQGKTQPVTLLPKGRFRNIINSCWRESPQKRPSFTQLLVILEETVGFVKCAKTYSLAYMCGK